MKCLLCTYIILLFFNFTLNAQTTSRDTATSPDKLRYPIKENKYPFSNSGNTSPMYLNPPSNVKQEVEYNPTTGQYEFSEKVGELNYRPPSSMNLNQYRKYEGKRNKTTYWHEKSREESGTGPSFMKSLRIGNQAFDKVFGTDVINITPKGSADLIFGYTRTRNDNPQLPLRNQRNGSFVFKEKIKLNVTGTIGDKMEVTLNFDTEATFDFENKKKLEYTGKEDEIIKKIEAGDVSFNVPGSLIKGSQSLFGIKTELQFGKLTVTSVISHQKGESRSINVKGGAQETEFEINADEYDVNKHFFLAHFFRDNYNNWLKNLPYIESQVQIQNVEVWVVNKQGNYEEKRNIVAFMDLGEGYGPDKDKDGESDHNFYAPDDFIRPMFEENLPATNSINEIYSRLSGNDLIRDLKSIDQGIESVYGNYSGSDPDYQGFREGRDYVFLESARPLSDREFTINRELGYISLNSPLRNDEILAVAFTYTYKGETYSVGEIAQNQSGTLILKMLKGKIPTPRYPTWDLMMKNVYSIGAYQLSSEDFVLNVLYRNDRTGAPVNYISEKDPSVISPEVNEQILLKVLDLDNLDSRNEPNPDGVFDFVEGVTVNSRNGRIYFPVLEPFGEDLRAKIVGPVDDDIRERTAKKYIFTELYDSTQTKAKQMAEKNKFMLQGTYKSSSSSEIPLNATNIPRGSVKVTSGGMTYTEGVDYTVDYILGRVKIINSGLLESGTPLQVSLESNSLFNIQTKTLMGTHLNYKISENFNVGGTVMHLTERPLTSKVNMGEEPISNTIWGLNTSYRTQSQWLTTMVDKLPLLETKEPSSISVEAEFAHLIPRQAKIIDKNGQAYIDDFEAAEIRIDLKAVTDWNLASAPRNDINAFNEYGGLESGYGRAKLAWFYIDPVFYGKSSLKPGNIDDEPDDLGINNHYTRRITTQEIFPEKDDYLPGQNYLSILNVSYYPDERGPYNYDISLSGEGKLQNPYNRWGAMTRAITNSDFETSNIEYIEFWLMDPFLDNDTSSGGDMYFQLGEISEDVIRDSRKSYENGFPTDPSVTKDIDTTVWGRVPRNDAISDDFDVNNRKTQDIGLDGLNNEMERTHFGNYLNSIPQSARPIIEEDVAADDFQYFLDDAHDQADHNILERYKNYNGVENNSASSAESGSGYTKSSTSKPDVEDINDDITLNTSETFFQYRIELTKEALELGRNHIVDMVEHTVDGKPERWYQFRIPLKEPDEKFGLIEDFKSVRFMRLVMTHFEEPVFLRFATLGLVRGDWRRYEFDMNETGPSINIQDDGSLFEVSAVNIEENSLKLPVNYVLPPGIDRVIDPYQSQSKELNEQSLLLKVKDLKDGDARAVFKNVEYDLRQYKNLKMYIHAEEIDDELVDHGEVTAFIRIGSDYQNNYYEYEVPLMITDPAANGKNIPEEVWPIGENMVVLSLQELVDLKQERNDAMKNDPRNYSTQTVYTKQVAKDIDDNTSPLRNVSNTLKVKGNPNLGNIRQIMLGIRNPGDGTSQVINDGSTKSAEVWFNELMLTDFNNKGGWAANGRIQTQLADFGVVNVAGSTSKPGFGSIEEKVEERSHEEINQIDISTNLEMGKFFPEKANVSIPLYAGLSKTIINPEYFPGDPDIKFKNILANAESKSERDSLKRIAQDYTSRKAINLTNVRWNKQLKKVKLVSPANFTIGINYAYTGSHNYTTEYNNTRKYGADFNYVYNTRAKNIQPLKKAKSFKKPVFRIIRDFNFNPYPSRFSFSTYFDRNYQEMKMRDINQDAILKIDSTINKDFRWDRKYNVKWDLSRSLKLDYSATNVARIDEPNGGYDWFEDDNQHWKDSVWQNIQHFGRNMNFTQSFDASYQIPINKIPFFNWLSINTSYGSTFSWQRGEILRDPSRNLGHTIKNSNTIKGSANINLRSIYNNVGYLKRLDSRQGSSKKSDDDNKRVKEVKYEKLTFFKKDVPKNVVHKLGTDKVTVKVTNAEGGEVSVNVAIVNENKISITAPEDLASASVAVTGEVPLGKSPLVFIAENTARLLTGFKSINITMSQTRGTILPGYLHETDYLGMDASTGDPGLPFVFGWQDWSEENIRNYMLDSSLTNDPTFNKPIVFTKSEVFNIRTTYEPYRGLRIDLTANRNYSETNQQLYFYDEDKSNVPGTNYFLNDRYKGGNFSISIISLASAFEKVSEENNWESAAFERMKTNRRRVSDARYRELTEEYPIYLNAGDQPISTYNYGYGPNSQEVLVPAFIAAYTGMDPENKKLTEFFWLMMPNWRITFDGLSKVELLQEYFKTITITHSYKSTYSIGSFATNVNYFDETNADNNDIFSSGSDEIRRVMLDNQGNVITNYLYSGVSIKEDMTPLIGVELGWNNSLMTRFQIGRSRMLALSLTNNQLNETRNKDFSIGAGYTFKEVSLTINQKPIKSDLDVKFDWTIKDNISIIRVIPTSPFDERDPEVTQGIRKHIISFTADYMLNAKLNLQLYFDYTLNKPHTSGTFLNTQMNVGFSLKLTL